MAFRNHVQTQHLSTGDNIAIYVSRGAWHNPTRDRAQVAAIGRIVSPVRVGPIDVGAEQMARWCKLDLDAILPARRGLEFAPLVPSLGFIVNKQPGRWGIVLRRTVVKVPDRDYSLIRKAFLAEVRRQARNVAAQ
jgi:hypothetical protein